MIDEVREFCRRVLGPGPAAEQAAAEAFGAPGEDRVEVLAAAGRACRARAARAQAVLDADAEADGEGQEADGLAASVARELAQASAAVPERQREALALRELLALSHEEIARVIGIEPAAVGPLLARARLRLRAELRGPGAEVSRCEHRDQVLRLLALRQDGEPVAYEEESWLLEHLRECASCDRAHGAMLEASACYRAWPVAFSESSSSGAR